MTNWLLIAIVCILFPPALLFFVPVAIIAFIARIISDLFGMTKDD